MLISGVLPMISVYRLPLGQYGYRGHVINFPQNLAEIVSTLPRLPEEVDVIVMKKKISPGIHKDFRIRRHVVQNALQYLKLNNKYYRDIEISQHRIEQLPVDDFYKPPNVQSEDCTTEESNENSTQEQAEEEENIEEDLNDRSSAVPFINTFTTESEKIKHLIRDRENFDWPEISKSPINEFTHEGYMALSFPTLYPTGEADFNCSRMRKVTIGNYFKHILKYKDGRFARHPRYR